MPVRRAAPAAACRPRPGKIPSWISGNPRRAPSPATRRSHASASSNPPPSAKPSIAAITGRGIDPSASNAPRNAAVTRGAAPGSVNSDTSAPAASAFSLPVTTTAFTSRVGSERDPVRGDLVEQRGGQRVQRWTVRAGAARRRHAVRAGRGVGHAISRSRRSRGHACDRAVLLPPCGGGAAAPSRAAP